MVMSQTTRAPTAAAAAMPPQIATGTTRSSTLGASANCEPTGVPVTTYWPASGKVTWATRYQNSSLTAISLVPNRWRTMAGGPSSRRTTSIAARGENDDVYTSRVTARSVVTVSVSGFWKRSTSLKNATIPTIATMAVATAATASAPASQYHRLDGVTFVCATGPEN